MNNPTLYAQAHRVSQTIVLDFLTKYIPLVRWRPDGGGSAMDIGCGPGNVTKHTLLPILPESQRELVATDISPQMIQYARNHHQHPRIIYDVLDIATKTLPAVYFERFDQVFSLLCLHWVHDQRQAMQNIFDMLQPGGDILLVYFIKNPVFEVILKMASFEHWKPYLKDPRRHVGVFHEVENVEETLYRLLEEVGFVDITCECSPKEYLFENMTAWIDLMTAVDPYIPQLAAHLKETYRKELCKELRDKAFRDGCASNDTEDVCFRYMLVNIHARKPWQYILRHT